MRGDVVFILLPVSMASQCSFSGMWCAVDLGMQRCGSRGEEFFEKPELVTGIGSLKVVDSPQSSSFGRAIAISGVPRRGTCDDESIRFSIHPDHDRVYGITEASGMVKVTGKFGFRYIDKYNKKGSYFYSEANITAILHGYDCNRIQLRLNDATNNTRHPKDEVRLANYWGDTRNETLHDLYRLSPHVAYSVTNNLDKGNTEQSIKLDDLRWYYLYGLSFLLLQHGLGLACMCLAFRRNYLICTLQLIIEQENPERYKAVIDPLHSPVPQIIKRPINILSRQASRHLVWPSIVFLGYAIFLLDRMWNQLKVFEGHCLHPDDPDAYIGGTPFILAMIALGWHLLVAVPLQLSTFFWSGHGRFAWVAKRPDDVLHLLRHARARLLDKWVADGRCQNVSDYSTQASAFLRRALFVCLECPVVFTFVDANFERCSADVARRWCDESRSKMSSFARLSQLPSDGRLATVNIPSWFPICIFRLTLALLKFVTTLFLCDWTFDALLDKFCTFHAKVPITVAVCICPPKIVVQALPHSDGSVQCCNLGGDELACIRPSPILASSQDLRTEIARALHVPESHLHIVTPDGLLTEAGRSTSESLTVVTSVQAAGNAPAQWNVADRPSNTVVGSTSELESPELPLLGVP